MQRNCLWCGKEFTVPRRAPRTKFCPKSRGRCAQAHWRSTHKEYIKNYASKHYKDRKKASKVRKARVNQNTITWKRPKLTPLNPMSLQNIAPEKMEWAFKRLFDGKE